MSDFTAANESDDGDTPAVIFDQAREMRSKQDHKLHSLLRIATGTLIVFLSIGTIAVAASEDLAPSTAVVVFSFAGVVATGLVGIEGIVSHRWREGPDIEKLLEIFRTHRPTGTQLRLALTVALNHDYKNNNETLRRVRIWITILTAVAFAGLLVLVAGLQELT